MRSTARRFLWLVSFCTLSSVAYAAQPRVVAIKGLAPGSPKNTTFADGFPIPVINAAGNVAFSAGLEGSGITSRNNFGYFIENEFGFRQVFRERRQAAGLPTGVYFTDFGANAINTAGDGAFAAGFSDGGVQGIGGEGVWTNVGGDYSLIAYEGGNVAGAPTNLTFQYFSRVAINDAGQTAFTAGLRRKTSIANEGHGIWLHSEGSLQLVARERDQAPGLPAGTNYDSFFPYEPLLNSAGQMAYQARLTGTGVTTENQYSLWSTRSGLPQMLVRAGDAAPGLPGSVFRTIGDVQQDDEGNVLFSSTVGGGAVDDSNNTGLWLHRSSGNLSRILAEGDQAPGTAAGVYFAVFDNNLLMNASGDISFHAGLRGNVTTDTRSGIWKQQDGLLSLVAKLGDHAPGADPGAVFTFIDEDHVLNAAGQVAFLARYAGGNGPGIWAEDLAGNLALIASAGDLIEVAPGDIRTIVNVDFFRGSDNSDGIATGFNDLGQLAYWARFADGSTGVFVSDLATVPEPSTLVLGTLGLFAFALFARRRRAR